MSNMIYASDPGLVIGFHGCDETVRDKVISGKIMLKASENQYDWLGAGMYFWQNNYERALDFATRPPSISNITRPAVLGAVFCLGNCLDLSDKKYIDLVRISYAWIRRINELRGLQLPQNRNAGKGSNDRVLRELDCSVIQNLHKRQRELGATPFDSIRGVFIEGHPLYEGAGFYDKTHVQVCIRNPNCIKGFFLPRKEIDWIDNQ